MRVRVYVDGFNLYYGGKAHAGVRLGRPPLPLAPETWQRIMNAHGPGQTL